MSKFNDILKKLDDLDRSVLLIKYHTKVKCSKCYRLRYSVEYHNKMLNIKNPICKICINRIRRDKENII